MTSFTISNNQLKNIKDQVVIVTGASSGIGLATIKRLFKHGAKVYACDLNPLPEPENSQIPFSKVDVTSWKEQLEMFKAALAKYGKIDHVFANAGIHPTVSLLEDDVDENGDLLPPNMKTFDVNLTGCLYTVKLGIHYLKQNPARTSIVVTASASSFTRFSATDYSTAKHAILGLVRSLHGLLHPNLPIRMNAIAPGWTDTGLVPSDVLRAAFGDNFVQSPDVVARSVIVLMVDSNRHGELIYSDQGNYWELENGEGGFHHVLRRIQGTDGNPEEMGLQKIAELRRKAAAQN